MAHTARGGIVSGTDKSGRRMKSHRCAKRRSMKAEFAARHEGVSSPRICASDAQTGLVAPRTGTPFAGRDDGDSSIVVDGRAMATRRSLRRHPGPRRLDVGAS